MGGERQLPVLNTRLVTIGGMLTALGAAISTVGASLAAAATVSALRQWAQSDHRRYLQAKARTASTAAMTAWREHPAREVVMPDVGERVGAHTRM